MRPQYHLAQKWRNGQYSHIGQMKFFRDRQGIGEDDFAQVQAGEALVGLIREERMRESEEHVFGAVVTDHVDRVDDAAGGINLVIDQEHVFPFDATDQRKRLRIFGIADAALFDKSQGHAQGFRPVAPLLGETEVRRNNNQVVQFAGVLTWL